jgi:hypothetical protein
MAISPTVLSEPVSKFFTQGSSTTTTSESVEQDVTCSETELYSFHRFINYYWSSTNTYLLLKMQCRFDLKAL